MNSQTQEIVLVCRKLSKSEEQALIESKKEIWSLETNLLSLPAFSNEQINIFPTSSKDYSEHHIQNTISFGHRKLIEGKSVAELLSYNETSYWYYLKFSLFQRSRNSFMLKERINDHLKNVHFEGKITLYSDDPLLANLLDWEVVQHTSVLKSKKNLSFNYFFNYSFLFGIRASFGIFRNRFKRSKAQKMIIANPYLAENVIDLSTGEIKKGDPHLQNLIDQSLSSNQYLYLTQLRPPSFEANHHLSINAYLSSKEYGKSSLYFEPYLFLALFSSKLRKRLKELDSIFTELEKGSQNNQLSKEDKGFLKVLLGLKKTLKLAIWREIAAEKLFSDLTIKKLIAIDEHSLQNRSIFTAAKQFSIQTFAIQHGAISKANIAYRFCAEDSSFAPWPDLSFIRGNFNLNALIENFYPKDQLKVVGHLRTDSIAVLKEKIEKKGEIVYVTQPMPPADQSLKENQLADFLSLCKALPNEKFVIKPHPNESEIDQYKQIANSNNYPNLSIYEGELYLLLASCKILITYYSTVGLEAIYFDKEVISLDYQGRDFQGYNSAGVAHVVKNKSELVKCCLDLLSGNLSTPPANKQQFIADRAFQIDGKATQRVVEELNQ